MVKDLRTGAERSDLQKVLDADLDEFMASSLVARGAKARIRKRLSEAIVFQYDRQKSGA
jgi:hypothetical protein